MEHVYNKIDEITRILNRIKSMHFLYCDYSIRIKEYKKQFNSDFEEFITTNNINIPEEENVKDSIDKKDEVEEKIGMTPSKDLKNLYKKLSLKLHPDKTNNEKDNEIFTVVDKLYKNCDLSGLLLIAIKYDIIKKEDILSFDESEIEKGMKIYTERINNIINSTAYKYFIADKNEKMDIINTIIESYKINNEFVEQEEERFSENGYDDKYDVHTNTGTDTTDTEVEDYDEHMKKIKKIKKDIKDDDYANPVHDENYNPFKIDDSILEKFKTPVQDINIPKEVNIDTESADTNTAEIIEQSDVVIEDYLEKESTIVASATVAEPADAASATVSEPATLDVAEKKKGKGKGKGKGKK